jgi:hypothetical protein
VNGETASAAGNTGAHCRIKLVESSFCREARFPFSEKETVR